MVVAVQCAAQSVACCGNLATPMDPDASRMKAKPLLSCLVAWLYAACAAADPVTFTLAAPQAREVLLAGEMTGWDAHKQAMTRGADGVWRLQLDLAPGQWLYKFVVDGHWVHDPATPDHDADGRGGQHSFIFVGEGPGTPPAAGRGRVETHEVPSAAFGSTDKVNVYLPPGFEVGQALPVLTLLHGGGMDADQWWRTGHIERYADHLIASGRIKPLVIVMPSNNGQRYDGAAGRFIADELPVWLKARYGLAPARAQSAVAGMSLGGYGAVKLPLAAPQRWGYAYALSGWYPDELIAEVKRAGKMPVELVLRCGTEDELIAGNRALAAVLGAQGQPPNYREDRGAHSFHYWSQVIEEMLLGVDAYFGQAR
jgi:enterochelin esterase-like enzyme